jgi:hypothetical protein
MAEQIAQDPAFAQMTAALQASMAGGEGAPEEGAVEREAEASGGAQGSPMDAEKYAAALSNVLQNQNFMEMAEKLGQQIMSVRLPSHVSCAVSTALLCRVSSTLTASKELLLVPQCPRGGSGPGRHGMLIPCNAVKHHPDTLLGRGLPEGMLVLPAFLQYFCKAE